MKFGSSALFKSASVLMVVLALFATGYAFKKKIKVSNVEELYAAVNNPTNAGAEVRLDDGIYVLTLNAPGGAERPNKGRLELQSDMSLMGKNGNHTAVIDASALPDASFVLPAPIQRTGVIRIGRGENSVERLTIIGNGFSAGGIETDLVGAGPTDLSIRDVISKDSIRGIDVRNIGPTMAGRSMSVEIENSDFYGETITPLPAQGIRIANLSANSAVISVSMKNNRSHNNRAGCLVANASSSGASIYVHSDRDRFDNNGAGCIITGGLLPAAGSANSNSTVFEADRSDFVNNTNPSFLVERGGIVAIGGDSPTTLLGTSNNELIIRLYDSVVANNQVANFAAWGARSTPASGGLAGLNNHVTIELEGDSASIVVDAIPSFPFEPGGTNTVTVIQ